MITRVETSQGWLEQITYNMNHMVRTGPRPRAPRSLSQ